MHRMLNVALLTSMITAAQTAVSEDAQYKLTVFAATDCPIAGRTARTLSVNLSALRKRDVKVLIVFPNAYETKESVTKWLKDHGLSGVGYSLSSEDAKNLKVRTTPTTVLHRGNTVVYTGKLTERDDTEKSGRFYPILAVD